MNTTLKKFILVAFARACPTCRMYTNSDRDQCPLVWHAGSKDVQSVGDWLETLGIPQYENTLIANGFDDLDFLGAGILEETDLVEMGVADESHRRLLLDACRPLPQLKAIGEGTL